MCRYTNNETGMKSIIILFAMPSLIQSQVNRTIGIPATVRLQIFVSNTINTEWKTRSVNVDLDHELNAILKVFY